MVPRSPKKCLFKPEYSKITGITKSNKSNSHARYVPCNSDINLGATEKAAIDLHLATKKHKDSASVIASNQSVAAFLPNLLTPTAIDDKTTAAEGSWAYHIVKHQQSFASADCVSSRGLFQTMFSDSMIAKTFGCAQTKTVKIITGRFNKLGRLLWAQTMGHPGSRYLLKLSAVQQCGSGGTCGSRR